MVLMVLYIYIYIPPVFFNTTRNNNNLQKRVYDI